MANKDLQQEAVGLVSREKNNWEIGTVFITDRVTFRMRDLIREARKNYWGVFNKPTDPVTGRRKTFVPLTESVVESSVKNIDLDTKDIVLRAKPHGSIGLTDLARNIVKNKLDEIYFGEILDEMERNLAIDGTAIWNTTEKDGKIDIRPVDLLNFYIDPTARSIQEAESVIERIVIPESEAKKIADSEDWTNKELLVGATGIDRRDGEFFLGSLNTITETRMVELWKRRGLIEEKFITGNEKDLDLVEAELITSGSGGPKVFHALKTVSGPKPYTEFWYTRISGRWYGKGIAEKLMPLQIWMNTIINIRINRSYISQLGIFKIKRNRGITPQMVNRLASNGAILVDDQDDIQQFVMDEASSASYQDEDRIHNWARQVTAAFEAVTGETLPASTTATTTAVQSRSAQSQFTIIKEGIGNSIIRWLEIHALPIMNKQIKKDDIIRITLDSERLAETNEALTNELLFRAMKKSNGIFDPAQIERERQRILRKLNNMNADRYVKLIKSIDLLKYDASFHVTNEKLDIGVLSQNLIQTLQLMGNIPGVTPEMIAAQVRSIYDTMGLTPPRFNPQGPTLQEQGEVQQQTQANQQRRPTNQASPVGQFTAGNVQGQV